MEMKDSVFQHEALVHEAFGDSITASMKAHVAFEVG